MSDTSFIESRNEPENTMDMIFEFQEGALDCAQALYNAGRPYAFSRTSEGGFMISTRD
jgi:hypothetical protein